MGGQRPCDKLQLRMIGLNGKDQTPSWVEAAGSIEQTLLDQTVVFDDLPKTGSDDDVPSFLVVSGVEGIGLLEADMLQTAGSGVPHGLRDIFSFIISQLGLHSMRREVFENLDIIFATAASQVQISDSRLAPELFGHDPLQALDDQFFAEANPPPADSVQVDPVHQLADEQSPPGPIFIDVIEHDSRIEAVSIPEANTVGEIAHCLQQHTRRGVISVLE